ncbi:NTP pyrophosphatase (non-canonical NTP hydrolase) [Alkalibacillus almallahensis]|nr:NTP pyrophosphatase (non-canonical NTP hydrolase) [Alkalibacillus almallahensis]
MSEFSYVCYSTEELCEFIEAVRQQSGEVTETHALSNGQGISVKYRMPATTK